MKEKKAEKLLSRKNQNLDRLRWCRNEGEGLIRGCLEGGGERTWHEIWKDSPLGGKEKKGSEGGRGLRARFVKNRRATQTG